MANHHFRLSDYEKERCLGSSSVGKTYCVKQKGTKNQFVLKTVKMFSDSVSGILDSLIDFPHRALLPICGYCLPGPESSLPLTILSPFVPSGPLLPHISARAILANVFKCKLLFGVAEALRHLEECGFSHGALTLQNILTSPSFEPQLSDYGLSALRPHSFSDVIGYGCLVYSVFTGEVADPATLPDVPLDVPPAFSDLIRECWLPSSDVTMESIVVKFLKNDLSIQLTNEDAESVQLYQAQVMAPEFAMRALVSVFEGLDAVMETHHQLEREVGDLKTKVNALYRNFHQIPQRPPETRPSGSSRVSVESESESGRQVVWHTPKPVRVVYDLSTVTCRPSSVKSVLSPALWASRKVAADWYAQSAPPHLTGRTPSGNRHVAPHRITASPAAVVSGAIRLDPHTSTQFPYSCGTDFDGIFAHWAAAGDLCSSGLLNVTGNSNDKSQDTSLRQIVDFSWTGCWLSQNEAGSWIKIDFPKHFVCLTDYTIKTYPFGPGFSHLKSWVIEGDIDGQWVVLDAQENNNDLNGKSLLATFRCSGPQRQCSSFRLRQTGPNHHDDNYLCITNIEFYGVVFEQ
jgi:serine/threonine protein kinase